MRTLALEVVVGAEPRASPVIHTRMRRARIDSRRAVDACVSGRAQTTRRSIGALGRLDTCAIVLTHAGRVRASHTRLTVAAHERPRTIARVRVDGVDARASVVTRGVQAVVYVLLAVEARKAGLTAAKVAHALVIVDVVRERRGDKAVAVAVGSAWVR